MRLQKFLSHAGVCSRRKGEEYIAEARVSVNGHIITASGTKIDPEKDSVAVDGKEIIFSCEKKNIYIALNKPAGYITSCSDKGGKIVLDLVDLSARIYPVGRLDKDSTGLILLTDDGELHNRLSHPSYNHEKEYLVTTVKPVSLSALKKMESGIMIQGEKTRRASVEKISKFSFRIILKQGRNRQIRKMVKKTGNHVKNLQRIRMGSLKLGSLKEGSWRYLTRQEIKAMKKPVHDHGRTRCRKIKNVDKKWDKDANQGSD